MASEDNGIELVLLANAGELLEEPRWWSEEEHPIVDHTFVIQFLKIFIKEISKFQPKCHCRPHICHLVPENIYQTNFKISTKINECTFTNFD